MIVEEDCRNVPMPDWRRQILERKGQGERINDLKARENQIGRERNDLSERERAKVMTGRQRKEDDERERELNSISDT